MTGVVEGVDVRLAPFHLIIPMTKYFLTFSLLKRMFTFVSTKCTLNWQECHKLNLNKPIFLLLFLERLPFSVFKGSYIWDMRKDFLKECNNKLYKNNFPQPLWFFTTWVYKHSPFLNYDTYAVISPSCAAYRKYIL